MLDTAQKAEASKRAIARWANPEYKKSQSAAIRKAPKCSKCGETDIEKFYRDKNGNRTNSVCRECHKAGCKERWHARDWLDKWASRNYKYNVTKEFLIELYNKQEGKCAICGEEPKTKRGLHIDHNHETGQVRGLLCHGCNVALGSFKENLDVIANAIKYLKEN